MEEEEILEIAKKGGHIEEAIEKVFENAIITILAEGGEEVFKWTKANTATTVKIVSDFVLLGMFWEGERLKEQTSEALDKLKKDIDNGNKG